MKTTMSIIKKISVFAVLAASLAILSCGCGNSDGSLSPNHNQTAKFVTLLGTYEGQAHSQRIMGATMTGIWTVKFFEDDNGRLMCKCSLRLNDSQNGWGRPTVAVADVKVFKGSSDRLYDLKAEASFSKDEPNWLVTVDGVSLTPGNSVGTITLFDMDANQITLNRK